MRKLNIKFESEGNTIKTLDYLEKKFFSKKILNKIKSKKISKELYFLVPENFSLIDNVDKSMLFIKSLFYYRYNMNTNIIIDLSKCKNVSMCALFVFDYVLLMILYEKDTLSKKGILNTKINYTNYIFSDNEKVNKVFVDAGASAYNDNDSEEFKKYRQHLTTIPLKLFKIRAGDNGRYPNELIKYLRKKGKVDYINTLDQNVQSFINECLEGFGYSLNTDGERVLQKIVSEWKSNCTNHLKDFCEYFCTGSLTYENNLGICELVLINFGDTINESIEAEETTEIGRMTFNKVTEHQRYNSNFTKENGIVLASIQKRVSRLKTENNTRGTGFPQIMEFFSKLSDDEENSKMTIISGKTQIRFAKTDYSRYNKNGEIYFNDEKIPSVLPDMNNVKKIDNQFPGTIISIRFIFKNEYIEDTKEDN